MLEIYKNNPESFIYLGDCIEIMDAWLKTRESTVDLIYIDPPVSSGHSFKLIQKVGTNQGRITHSEKNTSTSGKAEYTRILLDVLKKSKRLLKDSGNIFVHSPPKLSAEIKLMLDDVFGSGNFVNEIILKHDLGTNSQHHFTFSHETILFYRKSNDAYFDPESTAKRRGAVRRNHMKRNTENDGRVYYSITISGKEYRYYEDDLMYLDDVWDDIPESEENDRYKYDGQKPLALLERIIASACPKGGLVCDPFCGTGTAGLAAARLGRRFLMSDSSHFAVNISKNSLAQAGTSFCVDWGRDCEYGQKAEVQFSIEGRKVQVVDYRVAGGEKYYSRNLIPIEDTLIESWSAGRKVEDEFFIDSSDSRTNDKPSLLGYLHIKNAKGQPFAMIYDVFGNQTMHKLAMSEFSG